MKFAGVPNNFRFSETKEKIEVLLMPVRVSLPFGPDEMAEAKKLKEEYITEECYGRSKK